MTTITLALKVILRKNVKEVKYILFYLTKLIVLSTKMMVHITKIHQLSYISHVKILLNSLILSMTNHISYIDLY